MRTARVLRGVAIALLFVGLASVLASPAQAAPTRSLPARQGVALGIQMGSDPLWGGPGGALRSALVGVVRWFEEEQAGGHSLPPPEEAAGLKQHVDNPGQTAMKP